MSVNKFYPSALLRPYIESYRLYRILGSTQSNELLAEGYVEIGFKLNEKQILTSIKGRVFPVADIKILGQLTAPGLTVKDRGAELLVVRFFAHSASIFLDGKVADFTNSFTDLKDLDVVLSERLHNQVMESGTFEGKIRVIENYLREKLITNEKKLYRLRTAAAVSRLGAAHSGMVKISEICRASGCSYRYLQKLFDDYLGISPKTYLRILRYQKSRFLVGYTDEPFINIAYLCGYFDQAHFIKEFTGFTGRSPSLFRSSVSAAFTVRA